MNSSIFSLGTLFLVFGVVAYFYPFMMPIDPNRYTFQNFSFPLALIGVILIVVGSFIPTVITETRREVTHPHAEEHVIVHDRNGTSTRKTRTIVRSD